MPLSGEGWEVQRLKCGDLNVGLLSCAGSTYPNGDNPRNPSNTAAASTAGNPVDIQS